MKKCPRCTSVYGNEVFYCLNDGTALIEETFSLPSDADAIEAETVVRHEPFRINIDADNKIPDRDATFQALPPPTENVVVIPARTVSNSKNYVLFLVVGLLFGAGLVLAALLLSKTFNKSENADSVKTIQTETSVNTPPLGNKTSTGGSETVSEKHKQTTGATGGDFNGRVIALKARVRSAPSADAASVDTLPSNDRLEIGDRENSNSPWYRIECEHGTTGWMHGNTIEFTR